jgi:putative protease
MAGKADKVGTVTHYYTKIGVAIVKFDKPVKVGDKIKFEGGKTKFDQVISEMQLEHKAINEVSKGQEVGLKVDQRVREGDGVFLAV